MQSNPYQSPVVDEPVQARAADGERFPAGLIVLSVLAALHVGVAALLALGGLVMGAAGVVVSGMVATGFQVAIFSGLLLRQEWARIMLICMCYVSVVAYGVQIGRAPWLIVPLLGFEALTLAFAHSRRVREATRRKSLAQAYVYREAAPGERAE